MPSDPPVDFQALAQGATGTTNRDYPYAIKATDLMKNFVFATLIVDDALIDEAIGAQGHTQRRLKIPPPPVQGTAVLGAINGALTWIGTEDCE
jgi:hypothetical protein